jgi:hypothetical protein
MLIRRMRVDRWVIGAGAAFAALACQGDRVTSPLVPSNANSVMTAPTKKPARVTISGLVLSPTPMTLGGGATLYQITLSNPGSVDATGISIQSEVDQGNSVGREGGAFDAQCGPNAAGVVPPGDCTMVLPARADNAATGTGTLAVGNAKITIAVNQSDGSSTKQTDSKTLKTSIIAETHNAPYMSDVLLSFSSLVIGQSDPQPSYTVAVFNPLAVDQSLYAVQATVNQGSVTHGAGGTNVNCFPNAQNTGTIPPGSCVFGFTTSATYGDGAPGPFVAGPATWHLDFDYFDGTTTTTVSSRDFNITLTGP